MFGKSSIKLPGKVVCRSAQFRCATTERKNRIFSKNPNDEYQYLQMSKTPTLHFQPGLFRLPIPELDKTCERYLNALKPLLTSDQWKNTEEIVNSFRNGEGKLLHEALIKKDNDNPHTSYISKPWFDMYLKDRTPLPLNYNPAIILNRSSHPDAESQVCRATNLTISSLRFMKSLRKNILTPEIFHINPKKTDTKLFHSCMGLLPPKWAIYASYMLKAYPLDMSQHPSLFGSTRIPQENKDILVKYDSGEHILVLRKGHFFKVKVLDEEGDILSPVDILACFQNIKNRDLPVNQNSIGILTTENRNIWAKARDHLMSINPDNLQSFKAIDSALFVVCLDDEPLGKNYDKIMKAKLHGDGLNRWFDKSFSILISEDGLAAVNFEHSWGDGIAVLRYIKDVFDDTNSKPFTNSSSEPSKIIAEDFIQELNFTLDEKSLEYIRQANEKFNKVCQSLEVNVVEHLGLGRVSCLSIDVAADALFQLSFQVAYHKIYGKFVSTYESCSTAGFKHGRTETLRPCTEDTKNFTVKFNCNNRPSLTELVASLRQCSEVHKVLTKEALMGQGFDRHLYGLKYISEEEGRPLHDIYKSEAYKIINHNVLSTSTLSSDAVMLGGFGAVVPEGFGIGYVVTKNDCGAVITNYSTHTNGSDFAEALKSTLDVFSVICKQ